MNETPDDKMSSKDEPAFLSADNDQETRAEREARAARLRQRMDVLEGEFIRRQAEFERAEPPKSDLFFIEDLFKEFGDFFPASARAHIVNAQRESLSALRDLLNYWIDRSGGTTGGHRPPPERPTIM